MAKRKHEEVKSESSKATMAVMAVGGLAVAGLVVWALTRTVQPVPEAPVPAAVATAPAGMETTANPALPVPETTAGQTSTYSPNPPSEDENASVVRIAVPDLKARIDANQVTVVDVRDDTAFMTAHIPGAINLPMSTVEAQLAALPKDKPIVTYCTWPNEESSARAALIMRQYGITNVSALEGGFDAWKAGGNPVKAGG